MGSVFTSTLMPTALRRSGIRLFFSLLTKQEERLKITLKEGETKIQEMIKNQSVAGTQQPQHDESRK